MQEEKDDFWDIAALLPKKRKAPATGVSYGEVETVEVTAPPPATPHAASDEARRLHPDSEGGVEEALAYTPSDNPFITHVRVLQRGSNMRLFHGFKSEGGAWLSLCGEPVPYVPYFSFLPQYYQLNAAQKAYYLYFRDEANKGNYLDAGQSYVMLYVFEILNLPEYISPKIGVLRLARLWAAYRKKFPMLDKGMVGWLSDYALVHGVSCPHEILAPFLDEILTKAPLKEFYLGVEADSSLTVTDALIALTSAYKYQNSRYAEGEHKELLTTHVRAAAAAVLRHVFLEGGRARYTPVTKHSDCYTGALWAGGHRLSLEVTYYSLTGTDDLKILMTAAVRYAENKIRTYLAVKSRLSVSCLPDDIKALIDAYFARALPDRVRAKQPADQPPPEYEALYEPLSQGVSLAEAEDIENRSWENTWRLIPEEEREEILTASRRAEEAEEHSVPQEEEEKTCLSVDEAAFLRLLLAGDETGARAYVRERSLSYFTLGEHINEIFSDEIGDVVLELSGDVFLPIPDYEEEMREMLASTRFE